MKTGSNGIDVMHSFEGCKLRAYPDPGSALFRAYRKAGLDPYAIVYVPPEFASLSGAPWTIGRGDAGNCRPGQVITQQDADLRFARRLASEFEPAADKALTHPAARSQPVFDGFVCALYNIGPGAAGKADGLIVLASGAPSTCLRLLNAGDVARSADALLAWNRSGGQVMLGLRRRRAAERALMLGWSGGEAIRIGAAVQ